MCARVSLTATTSSCTGRPPHGLANQAMAWRRPCSNVKLPRSLQVRWGLFRSCPASSTAQSAWQGTSPTYHIGFSLCLICGQLPLPTLSCGRHTCYIFFVELQCLINQGLALYTPARRPDGKNGGRRQERLVAELQHAGGGAGWRHYFMPTTADRQHPVQSLKLCLLSAFSVPSSFVGRATS